MRVDGAPAPPRVSAVTLRGRQPCGVAGPVALVALVVLALLAGCAGGRVPGAALGRPAQAAANHATAGAAPSPSPAQVTLIVLENAEYEDVIGNRRAPYLNDLTRRYALADQYYALAHPSLPNYLALLGGDTFGIDSDCNACFVSAPNLVDGLEARGRTWKSYQEDLPAPCFLGDARDGYVARHNPFLYFRDIREDAARCQQVVPLTQLTDDLAGNTLPDFAWITPNVEHDMHDAPLAVADAWLARFVPSLLASDAWRGGGVLFITWDEGQSDAACCEGSEPARARRGRGPRGGGHVPLLVIAPSVAPGTRVSEPMTHYTLLRTVESLLDVAPVARSADVDPAPLLSLVSPAPAPEQPSL